MSPTEDPKIIDLINGVAKDVLTSEGDGAVRASPPFQSLEFFPPRTDKVYVPSEIVAKSVAW